MVWLREPTLEYLRTDIRIIAKNTPPTSKNSPPTSAIRYLQKITPLPGQKTHGNESMPRHAASEHDRLLLSTCPHHTTTTQRFYSLMISFARVPIPRSPKSEIPPPPRGTLSAFHSPRGPLIVVRNLFIEPAARQIDSSGGGFLREGLKWRKKKQSKEFIFRSIRKKSSHRQ